MTHARPARPRFEIELVTDTAGSRPTGGSGASCWGYNPSNVVRAGEDVFVLSWRDDLSLRVWRREDMAADSRFGAAIDGQGRILVAGGLEHLRWYVLDGRTPYAPLASGALAHPQPRGYHFAAFAEGQAHTFCSDDYFLPGEQYPTQTVLVRDAATGKEQTVVTPRGIYPVLRTCYYHNPDLLATPDDWRITVFSDVADTFADAARGTTEQQDLLVDADGMVHLIYFENRQPSAGVWAATGQDEANSRLYHAVGEPGRHDRLSEPVEIALPPPFWHLFVNTRRAGGTCAPWIDSYWTGAYQRNSHQVRYGRLLPE